MATKAIGKKPTAAFDSNKNPFRMSFYFIVMRLWEDVSLETN